MQLTGIVFLHLNGEISGSRKTLREEDRQLPVGQVTQILSEQRAGCSGYFATTLLELYDTMCPNR
jgi:hypothetical protein